MTQDTHGLINVLGAKLTLPIPMEDGNYKPNEKYDLKPFLAKLHGVSDDQISNAKIQTPYMRISTEGLSRIEEVFHYDLGQEQKNLQITWRHPSAGDDFTLGNPPPRNNCITLHNNETRMFFNDSRVCGLNLDPSMYVLMEGSHALKSDKVLKEHFGSDSTIQTVIFCTSTKSKNGTGLLLEMLEKEQKLKITGRGYFFMQAYSKTHDRIELNTIPCK